MVHFHLCPADSLDAFVSGVGTAGTLSGAGKKLKEAFPNIKLIAVEPSNSPVLSGGEPGKHILQGLGAGFVPENYNSEIVDEIIQISDDKAVEFGKRVIVAGLDMSFRAEPYHPMPELMGIAEQVDKLHAICTVCGKSAYASQRLIDGEPAYYDDPLVMVGASENYEARCRRHHIVRYREKSLS